METVFKIVLRSSSYQILSYPYFSWSFEYWREMQEGMLKLYFFLSIIKYMKKTLKKPRERSSGGNGHMYAYGWFILMYGKNHHNIVIILQLK